jgi:coupling of ubiquitin conjugation to ER degradation protein 1
VFAGSDSTERRSAADTLGFRPKPVTQDMVCFRSYLLLTPSVIEQHCRLTLYRICSPTFLCKHSLPVTFTHFSLLARSNFDAVCHDRDNVRYDLLRTGSVELTSNKILERGFLDAVRPLPYFHVPPFFPCPYPATLTHTHTPRTAPASILHPLPP